MKLIKGSSIVTDDFWHDLFEGGYIIPEVVLEDDDDIEAVNNAIEVLRDFRESLEEITEVI